MPRHLPPLVNLSPDQLKKKFKKHVLTPRKIDGVLARTLRILDTQVDKIELEVRKNQRVTQANIKDLAEIVPLILRMRGSIKDEFIIPRRHRQNKPKPPNKEEQEKVEKASKALDADIQGLTREEVLSLLSPVQQDPGNLEPIIEKVNDDTSGTPEVSNGHENSGTEVNGEDTSHDAETGESPDVPEPDPESESVFASEHDPLAD